MRTFRRFFRRYQSFIISFSIFGVCLIAIVAGLVPGAGKTQEVWQSVNDLKEKVSLLSTKANNLDRLDEQTLSKQFFDLVSALPLDKSVQTIFVTSDSVFTKSGITIKSMALQAPGAISTGSAALQGANGNKLVFTISGSGSYDQVRSLLRSIQSIRRLFSVRKLDLTTSATDVGITMEVETFFKPLSGAQPTVDTPLPVLSDADEKVLQKISTFPWLSQPVANVSARINEVGKADPFAP